MTLSLKLIACFILFLTVAICQLPEDDEVVTGIPGYKHAIYSGNK